MSCFVLNDCFFAPRIARTAGVTIPAVYHECRKSGRIAAFDLQWKPGDEPQPHIFWDSDTAKLLEGMCRMYQLSHDAELRKKIDALARRIASAQQPDGYLNTYYTQVAPEKRFCDLFNGHELYCAGHLMEAGAAHFRATGDRVLLDAVCRYADYIDSVFGPNGTRRGCPGHEEIELALCELYDVTGKARYLALAKHFLDVRGVEPNSFLTELPAAWADLRNRQAHKPVREQHDAVGHAVRMLYLARGMAEVGARTGDASLLEACGKIAHNIAENRMYITGGVGSSSNGEAFTVDGDLPDTASYAESCAAMALAFFARTMLRITGESFYAGLLERLLYNGALSGLSLSGDLFFYANLLASTPATFEHGWVFRERKPWFGCSCCPTSFARFVPQIGSFCVQEDSHAVRLVTYGAGSLQDQAGELLSVIGNYPYDGKIRIVWKRNSDQTLFLHIPPWSSGCQCRRNGQVVADKPQKGWLKLDGAWQTGDTVELTLAMSAILNWPAPRLTANRGMAALTLGPLVYCMESCDNGGVPVGNCAVSAQLEASEFAPEGLPEGVLGIEVSGFADNREALSAELYSPNKPVWRPIRCRFIPYALWQNRGRGEMAVFFPVKEDR